MRHIGDEGGLDGGDTFEEEKSTISGGGKEMTKCGRGVEDTWENEKIIFMKNYIMWNKGCVIIEVIKFTTLVTIRILDKYTTFDTWIRFCFL